MYSHNSLLVLPSGALKEVKLGHQMAAQVSPRLDMCQAPQQTADMNISHFDVTKKLCEVKSLAVANPPRSGRRRGPFVRNKTAAADSE